MIGIGYSRPVTEKHRICSARSVRAVILAASGAMPRSLRTWLKAPSVLSMLGLKNIATLRILNQRLAIRCAKDMWSDRPECAEGKLERRLVMKRLLGRKGTLSMNGIFLVMATSTPKNDTLSMIISAGLTSSTTASRARDVGTRSCGLKVCSTSARWAFHREG